MALNIKDPETEQLAREIARLTGESKTAAVRTALRERKERLELGNASADCGHGLRELLENEIWPALPRGMRGHALDRQEQDEILGYDA